MTPLVKKLAIFLAISVGLNAFLAGVAVMGLVRGPGYGPGPAHGLPFSDKDAPWRDSKEVRQLLRSKSRELKSQRRALHASRERVRSAMEAEPFEPKRLEEALASLRAETTSSQAAVHASLVEAASRMTLEERRRFRVFEGRGSGKK